MVSHRYWTASLDRPPTAIGGTVRIRGNAYTITASRRSSFTGMVPVLSPELWLTASASLDVEPVGMHDTIPSPTGTTRLDRRADRWLFMRARLKPGTTIDGARANLTMLISGINAAIRSPQGSPPYAQGDQRRAFSPDGRPDRGADRRRDDDRLRPGTAHRVRERREHAAGRASGRQKEIGIRLAIGASRARLVQQLITESVTLSLLGALSGTLLAWWLTSAVASMSLPLPIRSSSTCGSTAACCRSRSSRRVSPPCWPARARDPDAEADCHGRSARRDDRLAGGRAALVGTGRAGRRTDGRHHPACSSLARC